MLLKNKVTALFVSPLNMFLIPSTAPLLQRLWHLQQLLYFRNNFFSCSFFLHFSSPMAFPTPSLIEPLACLIFMLSYPLPIYDMIISPVIYFILVTEFFREILPVATSASCEESATAHLHAIKFLEQLRNQIKTRFSFRDYVLKRILLLIQLRQIRDLGGLPNSLHVILTLGFWCRQRYHVDFNNFKSVILATSTKIRFLWFSEYKKLEHFFGTQQY